MLMMGVVELGGGGTAVTPARFKLAGEAVSALIGGVGIEVGVFSVKKKDFSEPQLKELARLAVWELKAERPFPT